MTVAMRRGVGIVITILFLAVLVSMAGVLVAYLLATRGPTVAAGSTLMLPVRGDLAEMEPGGISQLLVSPPTVRSLAESLRKAKVDDRVRGVILAPAGTGAPWAKLQALRDAIIDFKRSGKPIVAYLEYGGAPEYYLAAACDRVFLMPTSPLDLSGIATYEVFLRGLLDKVGASPDLLRIGEYKTMANTFTETTVTPAHREMLESLTADLYEQLVRGIADGRRKSAADVRALLDEGPFLPDDAVRLGLVDDLAYEDQLDDKVRLGVDGMRVIDDEDYRTVSLASLGLNRGPRIAVIYAVGLITAGESRLDGPGGPIIGSDTFVEYVRTARADDAVRAIVVRVNSPGGSAVASDVIWRELLLARNVKPVIASLSDVAASGGYYIALPAHSIVAHPGTLTGSIGVVMGKFALGETLRKVGINVEAVSRGRFAEIHSPVRRYTPEERAKLEEQMQATYDGFVEKVAQSRRTTPERIDALAQGRVWTGQQAKLVGLVDDLGGLDRAIALAKERTGIPAESDVEIVVYPPRRGLYEVLLDPWRRAGAGGLASLLGGEEVRALGTLTAPLRLFRQGEPLALMPFLFASW